MQSRRRSQLDRAVVISLREMVDRMIALFSEHAIAKVELLAASHHAERDVYGLAPRDGEAVTGD